MTNPSPLWKLAQCFCRIFTTCYFDLQVFGEEHVPKEGSALLVANHQSYLDPVLIGVRLPRPLSYIAKSELFENQYADRLLRWLNGFPVHQGTIDLAAMRETIARLRSGHALAIFPEGSRTNNGEMLKLERGVALIIRRTKAPVIPVVIMGSYHAWPINQPMFRPWKIRLLYGPPMQLSELPDDEILRTLEDTLRGMLAELRRTNESS